MKKTFTLLAIAAFITSATFAQYNHSRDNNYDRDRQRDVTVNDGRDGNGYGRERGTYYFSARDKDMQLFSINREYSGRIESVRHKFFMGRARKEQIICSLELERNAEIHAVMAKFNDHRNQFNNDYRHEDRDRRRNW